MDMHLSHRARPLPVDFPKSASLPTTDIMILKDFLAVHALVWQLVVMCKPPEFGRLKCI
jgi:hypothetical protein